MQNDFLVLGIWYEMKLTQFVENFFLFLLILTATDLGLFGKISEKCKIMHNKLC